MFCLGCSVWNFLIVCLTVFVWSANAVSTCGGNLKAFQARNASNLCAGVRNHWINLNTPVTITTRDDANPTIIGQEYIDLTRFCRLLAVLAIRTYIQQTDIRGSCSPVFAHYTPKKILKKNICHFESALHTARQFYERTFAGFW
jgi:hypothetical protein